MSNIVAKTVIGLGTLAALNCLYAVYVWNFGGISFSKDEVAARKLTKILSIANSLNVFPIGLVLAIVLHKKIHLIR